MGQRLHLRTGDTQFAGVLFDRESKQLFFRWFAETEVSNINYMFLLILKLGWPPIRWLSAFVSADVPKHPERTEE